MFKLFVLTFLVGAAVGVAGTLFGPRFVDPYLPDSWRTSRLKEIGGEVVRKQQEGDRLLLMVETPQGVLLATIKERMTEINLLVEEGDTLMLSLDEYKPFVEDPVVRKVSKQTGAGQPAVPRPSPPPEGEDQPGTQAGG